MTFTEYETTVVMRPDIGGDAIETTLDKLRTTVGAAGKLIAINHWGRKRLAYEVSKCNRGVYVHTHYLGAGKMVAELERDLRLSEDVLRFLTVRLADSIDASEREVVEYVRPEYEAPEETEEEVEELATAGLAEEAAPEAHNSEAVPAPQQSEQEAAEMPAANAAPEDETPTDGAKE